MEATSFSLVVIRSSNLEAALSFYSALGLNFVREQHGSGPVHYSCDVSGVILEIYPGQLGAQPEPKTAGSTMLGFNVASLDETLARLRALGIEPKSEPKDSSWGRWVNVVDPDDRMVQLNQVTK